MVCIILIKMRIDTLTSTKDVICNGGIALNGDITIATAFQYGRHFLCVKAILAHRSNLTATIDAMFHTGMALNGDNTITTHQRRVAMSL